MKAPTCLKWDNMNIKKNNACHGLKNHQRYKQK